MIFVQLGHHLRQQVEIKFLSKCTNFKNIKTSVKKSDISPMRKIVKSINLISAHLLSRTKHVLDFDLFELYFFGPAVRAKFLTNLNVLIGSRVCFYNLKHEHSSQKIKLNDLVAYFRFLTIYFDVIF